MSSDDDNTASSSSAVESEATPMPSSGSRRPAARGAKATTSSHVDENSLSESKPRSKRQRKVPVIIESDSEDFSSPIQTKQTVKPVRSRRVKPQRQSSNSENEKPRLVNGKLIPKATKPPILKETRSR